MLAGVFADGEFNGSKTLFACCSDAAGGYQWRGALDRLSAQRRCIAPDLMGAGYSDIPEGTDQSPDAQTAMLAAFLDALRVESVDLVGSDKRCCR